MLKTSKLRLQTQLSIDSFQGDFSLSDERQVYWNSWMLLNNIVNSRKHKVKLRLGMDRLGFTFDSCKRLLRAIVESAIQ